MPQSATAVICHRDKILLFQRDDIPTIPDPGMWQLPGGGIDEGETHDAAVRRELIEEVSYVPKDLQYVGMKDFEYKQVFVYWTYVDDNEADRFKLGETEGQAIGFYILDEALKLPLSPNVRKYMLEYKDKLSEFMNRKVTPRAEDFGFE